VLTFGGSTVTGRARGEASAEGLAGVYPPLSLGRPTPQHAQCLSWPSAARSSPTHRPERNAMPDSCFSPHVDLEDLAGSSGFAAGVDPQRTSLISRPRPGKSLWIGVDRRRDRCRAGPCWSALIVLDELQPLTLPSARAIAPLLSASAHVSLWKTVSAPYRRCGPDHECTHESCDDAGRPYRLFRGAAARLLPCDVSALPLCGLALEGGERSRRLGAPGRCSSPPTGICERFGPLWSISCARRCTLRFWASSTSICFSGLGRG